MAGSTSTVTIVVKGEDKTSGAFKGVSKSIGGIGKGLAGAAAVAGGALVIGIGAAGAALGTFVADGISKAASLEQQMANIAAVMGKTSEEIAPLKDLIQDLAVDPNLKVSAFEAADAVELLARNGLKMDDILQGAGRAVVVLANATGADFGAAADVATDAMAQFGFEASEMDGVVDGVVSTVNNSKLGFDDYRLAIGQAGGVAGQLGVEFDDFNTILAATAHNFSGGSDAGTSFKTFLGALVPQSNKAAGEMKKLGLITEDGGNQFFTASGELKSFSEISEILSGALEGVSEEQQNVALKTIFGRDAIRTALGVADAGQVIYTDLATAAKELGLSQEDLSGVMEGGITQFEALQVTMAQTDAADAVAERMKTLQAKFGVFKDLLGSVSMQIGDLFIPMLKDTIIQLTTLVDKYAPLVIDWLKTNLPLAIQTASDYWTNTLQPALKTIWDFIQVNIIPILTTLRTWLETNLPVAIQAASDFFTTVMLPAFMQVWDSISVNLLPLLVELGTFLEANLPAAIQFLSTAVQFLADLWNNVLFPAFQAYTDFLANVVIPGIAILVRWLQQNLPIAIQFLVDLWNNVLFPAFQIVSEWMVTTLFPALQTLFDWLQTNVPIAIQYLVDLWNNVLFPAFQTVSNFLTEVLIPLLMDLRTIFLATLYIAINIFLKLWNDHLYPALQTVYNFISNLLKPLLTALGDDLKNRIGVDVKNFKKLIEDLGGAFEWVADKVQAVIGWVTNLADEIRNMDLPDWIKMDSPPPLATAFDMVAESMRAARMEIRPFTNLLNEEMALSERFNSMNGGGFGSSANSQSYNLTINSSGRQVNPTGDFNMMRSRMAAV